ncbi:MAG: homoaconitate hydratase [Candidatus Aenigmatarchaeota archaeon]
MAFTPLIFDTTLRDGEQMPSVVFSIDEKIALAKKFDEFGVNFIDIMPVVSEGERYVAKTLSKEKLDAELSALTRLRKYDVDTAIDCDIPRVLLFTPISDIQRLHKLNISREENLSRSLEIIDYSKEHGLKVDFGCEDASRLYLEDPEYLASFVNSIKGKIDYFFPADTVSCLLPNESYEFVSYIKKNCGCKIALHNHNDLGLATANTLEGLRAGAEVFSGTFTGIGERAGNAPIEEVCVALRTKGIDLGVKYDMLTEICSDVTRYSGVSLQKNKPIIGENAFSHESGTHVQSVIKDPNTYEIIDPLSIGQKRRFLFGKQSGSSGLRYALSSYEPSDAMLAAFLDEIKKESSAFKRTFSQDEIVEKYRTFYRSEVI